MNNPSNTSLDLPPALAAILNMGKQTQQSTMGAAPQGMGVPQPMGMPPAMGVPQTMGMGGMSEMIPSYEDGGMVGVGGMPEPMGGMPGGMPGGAGLAMQGQAPQGPMSPQMLSMQVNQIATQNPQQVEQIRMAIMEAMQSGELTEQELNMVIQLATVASQNPEMYPQVRTFAIQQGIATEQDLPPQFDEGLIMVLLLAAKSMQSDVGGQNMMQGGTPATAVPSMATGGTVPDSKKADGAVLINAHEGEYVIPSNVVKMKGKEFFDNLVEKYRE
jgi:hypothetical protein